MLFELCWFWSVGVLGLASPCCRVRTLDWSSLWLVSLNFCARDEGIFSISRNFNVLLELKKRKPHSEMGGLFHGKPGIFGKHTLHYPRFLRIIRMVLYVMMSQCVHRTRKVVVLRNSQAWSAGQRMAMGQWRHDSDLEAVPSIRGSSLARRRNHRASFFSGKRQNGKKQGFHPKKSTDGKHASTKRKQVDHSHVRLQRFQQT